MKIYTEQEIKAIFALPLKERVKICYIDNYCDEEQYLTLLNGNDYTSLLRRVWSKDPAVYYLYFNDYLKEGTPDFERCYKAYKNLMNY